MIIVCDFDGTVVLDQDGPLVLAPKAKDGLAALKRAGHTIILQSSRASPCLRINPILHPLARVEGATVDYDYWIKHEKEPAQQRYQEMLDFVEKELPDVFDVIDDGLCGKIPADVYLDDAAYRVAHNGQLHSIDWRVIMRRYGEPL